MLVSLVLLEKLAVALSLLLKRSMNGGWLRLPATIAHLPSKWRGSSWPRGRSKSSQASGAERLTGIEQRRAMAHRRSISVFVETIMCTLSWCVQAALKCVIWVFFWFYSCFRKVRFHNSGNNGEQSLSFTLWCDCETTFCLSALTFDPLHWIFTCWLSLSYLWFLDILVPSWNIFFKYPEVVLGW